MWGKELSRFYELIQWTEKVKMAVLTGYPRSDCIVLVLGQIDYACSFCYFCLFGDLTPKGSLTNRDSIVYLHSIDF